MFGRVVCVCVFLVRCVFVRSLVRVFARYSGVLQVGVINFNRFVEKFIEGFRGIQVL